MKATLKNQRGTERLQPASIAQLSKLNQIIADQKPTNQRMQEALRFVPDLFQGELKEVNRYDLCRLIKRPLPFKVFGGESNLEIDYDTPWYPALVTLHERRIITQGQLDVFCDLIKRRGHFTSKPQLTGSRYDNFFVVGCCDEEILESFDLQPANLIELLSYPRNGESRCVIDSPHSKAIAGKCGDGWFWYTLDQEGGIESMYDAFPDNRSYDEIFRYGKRKLPTLVRRILK